VFRVKSAATGISILIPDGEYKVTYKDGKFESDDPSFLTRNLNLPYVSVDLNDPQTKDFEFPLTPGKKWSFHYRGEGRVTLSRRWRFVDAEIVRRVPQPLETRAGKFKVIEIRRTDWGRRGARLDFTYFYSPETKSVIKLTADLISAQEETIGHFESELVKYGHKDPVVQAPVYEEGDWWKVKIEMKGRAGWTCSYDYSEYLLEIREGKPKLYGINGPNKEEIDCPRIEDQILGKNTRKLKFPLRVGNRWVLRHLTEGGNRWITVEHEVLGWERVKIPRGVFEAFKLRSYATATTPNGYVESRGTYYYSPKVKAIILRKQTRLRLGQHEIDVTKTVVDFNVSN